MRALLGACLCFAKYGYYDKHMVVALLVVIIVSGFRHIFVNIRGLSHDWGKPLFM